MSPKPGSLSPSPGQLLHEIDERTERHSRILEYLAERTDAIMATLEELTTSFETLKTDIEAKAAEAKAEFAKLEEELAAAGTPVELAPLKESIDSLDAAVKGAEVPSA